MRASRLLVALGVLGAPRLAGQWSKAKDVTVQSCPVAVRLIGPMRGKGKVQENYKPSADTTALTSGLEPTYPGEFGFSAEVVFPGRGPVQYPAPFFRFIVADTRKASALLKKGGHPDLLLVVDDNVRIALGPASFGDFRGPDYLAVASLTVQTLPGWALALAKADHASLMVDSMTFRLRASDLRDYKGLYGVAVCDTLPAR